MGTLIDLDVTAFGFSSTPAGIAMLRTPPGGTANWDHVILSIDGQNSSSTNVRFIGTNQSGGSTSGTVTVSYQLWQ
jgi:hypothetical protein